LYQPEGENLWVRPKKMFFEEIEIEAMPDGRQGIKKPRFEYLG
jgi:hypothetical protein